MNSPLDFEPFANWLREYDGVEIVLFFTLLFVLVRLLVKWAKTAIPQVETAIRFLRALGDLPHFMTSTMTIIGELKHEVLPNNGGSLRDETVTTALRVEKIEAKMSKDQKRLEHVEGLLQYRQENNLGIPQPARAGSGTLPEKEETP